MRRRLYVAGAGEDLRYCTALNVEDAARMLGSDCRTANPDDLRTVWRLAKLESLSGREIRERLGVSRQTVDNWWWRAGGEGSLPRRSEFRAKEKIKKIRALVQAHPNQSVSTLAVATGVRADVVREVAAEVGVRLPTARKRPSDEELVAIAAGKTWQEFADAVGLQLSTLRTYIYARPKLSKAIRKVRAPQSKGGRAHGKIEPEKIVALHKEGHSAYRIAQIMKVEQMTVRHWLKRKAQEESDDCAHDPRPASDALAGSHRRTAS